MGGKILMDPVIYVVVMLPVTLGQDTYGINHCVNIVNIKTQVITWWQTTITDTAGTPLVR